MENERFLSRIGTPRSTKWLDLTVLPWQVGEFKVILDEYLTSLDPDDDSQLLIGTGAGQDSPKMRLLNLLKFTLPGRGHDGSEFDEDGNIPNEWEQFRDNLRVMRETFPALRGGDYYSMRLSHVEVLAFVRETELQRVVVMCNFSELSVDLKLPKGLGIWIAGTKEVWGDGIAPSGPTLNLKPFEGRIFELRRTNW